MEKCTKFETDCKQEARENLTLGTQGLFGIVRNIHCKIKHLRSATHSPTYETAEILRDRKIRVEQKKAEAEFQLRRKIIIE